MEHQKFEKMYLMQTVQKTIVILRAFTKEQPKLSLTELNKKTGIGLSSLQRFVATLVYEGFLIRDDRTKQYQLGLSLIHLGKLVEEESSIITIAQPILQQLNKATKESISMSIIDGNERRCIMNIESSYALSARNHVGDTSPLYAGASAKSLLAFLPQEEIDQYLDEVAMEHVTENTVVDREQLLEQLQEIRKQQYVFTRAERIIGACSFSTAIISNGRPVASIAIIIPEARFDEEQFDELRELILHAKFDIEKQLNK